MPDFDLDAALNTPADWGDTIAVVEQKAESTCYCPGGGGDWQPMVKLLHLCDTFVYADLCADGAQSAAALCRFFEQIGDNAQLGYALRCAEVRALTLGTDFCWMESALSRFLEEHCPANAAAYREAVEPMADTERWGVDARLVHGVGEEAREIRLLFFQAEALAVYRGLYSDHKIAPHAVVLPPQGGRRSVRSQQLALAGPLGAVLRAEPRPALVLAGQEDMGALAGTPWPHLWRELGGWNRAAFNPWPLPARWWFEAMQVMF